MAYIAFSSNGFLKFDINIAINLTAKEQRLKFPKECVQYQFMDRFNK